jgi:acyl-CoA synthetase (AMP-forming)/AMP-acid ligase II
LFDGEWLRTGDLGCFDDDGFLRIVGRIKDIIIKNGMNIVPNQIDSVIESHPSVKECKTFGVPDSLVGERIVTACVPVDPRQPPSPDEIRAHVLQNLSAFKCPDRILMIDALPRTSSGKVAIARLRERVTAALRPPSVTTGDS